MDSSGPVVAQGEASLSLRHMHAHAHSHLSLQLGASLSSSGGGTPCVHCLPLQHLRMETVADTFCQALPHPLKIFPLTYKASSLEDKDKDNRDRDMGQVCGIVYFGGGFGFVVFLCSYVCAPFTMHALSRREAGTRKTKQDKAGGRRKEGRWAGSWVGRGSVTGWPFGLPPPLPHAFAACCHAFSIYLSLSHLLYIPPPLSDPF